MYSATLNDFVGRSLASFQKPASALQINIFGAHVFQLFISPWLIFWQIKTFIMDVGAHIVKMRSWSTAWLETDETHHKEPLC